MKGYAKAPSGNIDRARRLRRDATDAEKRLWRALRETFPEARFRRQSPVGPYIADFLSFRHKLIVEVDGGQHTAQTDARRTAHLEREGFRILRFWNNDALTNTEGVLTQISLALREREEATKSPKGEGDKLPSTSPSRRATGPFLSQRKRSSTLLPPRTAPHSRRSR